MSASPSEEAHGKTYLFFAAHAYSYEILRPLQKEIWRRGHRVAWWLEDTCPDRLLPGEERVCSLQEVKALSPLAVFVPGNYVYDFFPGIKVAVFHGYPMRKRVERVDDHFTIRGWFDIYCTAGPTSTPTFSELAGRHRYFRVYETGWPKVDAFFAPDSTPEAPRERPAILYAPTFSRGITSAPAMLPVIDVLASSRPWDWIITFHPKLDDPALLRGYGQLAARHPNVDFRRVNKGLETFRESDVMLTDSSSIMVEYMMLDKPVVTFRNTHPGPFLLDVTDPAQVAPALERALSRPPELLKQMKAYTMAHDPHRDGQSSARVLDAVDHFILHHAGHLPRKPLNLLRRLKLRRQYLLSTLRRRSSPSPRSHTLPHT